MQNYNADFHIHGPYAGGTSKNLCVEKIAEMGFYKGLQISPVGDLTHKPWFDDVFSKLQCEDEIYFYDIKTIFGEKRTNFILSTEVQAKDRTHHIVLFPDKKSILGFRERIKSSCRNLDGPMNGRPWLSLNAEEIAKICVDSDLTFGPAHAFTPYFGVYAHYDSLKIAYGKYFEDIDFLELGLSADSYLANDILELKNTPFLSNSDAHSFWPHRLGREFNTFQLNKPNYYEIEKALGKKEGRDLILNVGLNPKEGMYHKTRCKDCLTFYSLEDAVKLNWRCPCKGIIKKGVYDRIKEIAPKREKYDRPEYKHILALAEIIAIAQNSDNPLAEKVQKIWWDFIKIAETEINVLLYLSEPQLNEINPEIAKYIIAFRNDYVNYFPGGAGQYGKPIIAFSELEKQKNELKIEDQMKEKKYLQKSTGSSQRTLFA
ncbi:MAG: phosphotransferase [Candidatus Diapherotrites archaeon CG08_land_8_20_14_0_20_30_16]|nr:MAG: phosphotransferase [Candidatus Diapherotrites archaeon CG08_land_8_20_14_0_20_30_16]